ncbi:uncharacterized protein LOC100166257 precursor [Acyrthosiphon pisum]|uniref:ACYPI007142 protein n=1 Tax=Acyrthosiphon pisum TaxID=7029 RepID=C4WXH4_ACYPI|nr:uncharacterized protein LOC100166257 precursor [Acyrthosiphon pisum]BAH72594.1 ACYPI007142 [Acyrthosiphon pisum]|eukprot:NP_001280360.1 uncharacterized protein LOC100166257 precursor [Acyrthosiphon pisum]
MNGKIVLCLAAVFVGQAMSAATGSTPEVEDIKKVAEQMSQTFMSVANHLVGITPNSADAQKSIEKFRTIMTKGFTDIETEANKMKDIVRKNADPKLVEKYDELEKELKKHLSTAKDMFEDKVVKPISEKVELKKITEKVIKTTKDMEATVNQSIDGFKKQ